MRFAVVFVVAAVAALACAGALNAKNDPYWHSYKKSFGKKYANADEENFRYQTFVENMKRAAEFAEMDPEATYGMTSVSDRAPYELNGLRNVPAVHDGEMTVEVSHALPTSYDARKYGLVNSVRDQGQCGSCWAFATVAVMEAGYKKAYGSLPALSEQQLVDCDPNDSGCGGGWPDRAFAYLKTKSLMKRADYPYTAHKGTCKWSSSKGVAKVKEIQSIRGNAANIMNAVYTYGAVAVALDATKFNSYSSGIMNGAGCSKRPNHAVVVVGWGTSGSTPYWIVRNSWGFSWGESGYIRIVRGNDACGIEDYPMVATVKK